MNIELVLAANGDVVMVVIRVGVVAEAAAAGKTATAAGAAGTNLPLIPLELQRDPQFYRLFHLVTVFE